MKIQKPKPQETNKSTQSLMSRQLVAQKLGVSPMTIKRYEKRGLLQPIYLSSRAIRYRPEDVETFILEASL